jgi:RHS repeat-associated protein
MTITRYYVTSDAMGSATAILDEDGNILERRSYEAFGEVTCMQPDGSPVEVSPTGVDVGFQGQIRDEATGLCQMGFRWYSPVFGRWLSRDPVGLKGGPNQQEGFANNPVSASDELGMDVYIQTTDGQQAQFSSSSRILEFLCACKTKCISKISIVGHADKNFQSFDPLEKDGTDRIRLLYQNGADGTSANLSAVLIGTRPSQHAKNATLSAARDAQGVFIGTSIDQLLAQKMADGSRIDLWGCEAGKSGASKCPKCEDTGGGGGSLALHLSRLLPKSEITGSAKSTYKFPMWERGFPSIPDEQGQLQLAKFIMLKTGNLATGMPMPSSLPYIVLRSHTSCYKDGKLIRHSEGYEVFNPPMTWIR